jgi:hypothetical protein
MTRVELAEGMADYWDSVHAPARYQERALGFLRGISRLPKVKPAVLANLLGSFGMLWRLVRHVLFRATPGQRRALLAVFKAAVRQSPGLMPRVTYAQGAYLLDERIARLTSAIARDQAAWERAHPEEIRVLPRTTAVSAAVREWMPAIAARAWRIIRGRVAEREAIYRLTLAAVGDYHDRFGAALTEFDDLQADHLERSCERVLASDGYAAPTPAHQGAPPPDGPPPGFAREILDALDRSVNVAQGGWEKADPPTA